jgi:hypothetical protein
MSGAYLGWWSAKWLGLRFWCIGSPSYTFRAVYYDPQSDDFLEAGKATLPIDQQRRMVAIEVAANMLTLRHRVAGKPATGIDVDDLMSELRAIASRVEAELLEEERGWELAEMPYDEYLATCEWHERRAAARQRAGERCQVCNSEGPLDVHHRTYERRGRERDDDLIVLCRGCHELFHRFGRLQSRG